MHFSSFTKIEKICSICFGIALLVFIVGGMWLIFGFGTQETEPKKESEEFSTEALADEMINYPNNIQLNKIMPELTLYNENGDTVKLSDFKGKNVIILFWTSWCKYCKEEFGLMEDYAALLENYDDVEFILLNKLDGEKETKEQALTYLKEHNIPFSTYFDEDLKVYNDLGIKIVPTMLGIDSQGVLKICNPGNIGGVDNLSALIDYVKYGGSYGTEQFITKYLTGEEGGVHVNYLELDTESPSGNDVLSESQGIMMEYAFIKEDKELFDRYFGYVTKYMLGTNSLAGWMVTEDGSARVNSLLDDLRIYKALYKANQQWGGYDEMLQKWEGNLLKYNTNKNHIVDSYDFKFKKKANRITLCFADFEALKLIQESDVDSNMLYEDALNLVQNGYISDDFPFYYSWYDYKKNQYKADDLNMAEAMHTLLNLSKVGKLREETIKWLQKSVDSGGIKARYTLSGEVVDGYNYESTAIYAMVVMIAKEIGDEKMMTNALARMEIMRLNKKNLALNGSFGVNEGEDIYSFDQCMALLAYATIK